jgi:Family of unknown function (DUF5935)
MRDLVFVIFLLALIGLGFKRPFLFVPVSLIAFMLAFIGWAAADDKRGLTIAPRQALLFVLLVYCGVTTGVADFPLEALAKWDWVWKALVFAIFLPLTLRTRLRIEALALFMVLCAASIIIVGGIKTLASGGGYGVLNLMVSPWQSSRSSFGWPSTARSIRPIGAYGYLLAR